MTAHPGTYTQTVDQRLSRDGRYLALTSYSGLLSLVRLSDGTSRDITTAGGTPTWLPNSGSFLWSRHYSTQSPFTAHADLTQSFVDGTTPDRVVANGQGISGAQISPDGGKLVFFDLDGPKTSEGGPYLAVMNTDGTDRHSLGIRGNGATWAPDRSRIAFTTGGNASQLMTVAPDGTDPLTLPTGGRAADPAYGTDGTEIFFGGGGDLFAIHPDGTGLRVVSGTADVEEQPTAAGPETTPTTGAAPTGVTASLGSAANTVDLTWTPPASAVQGYSVVADPSGPTLAVTDPLATSATLTGLAPGKAYRFFVSGVGPAGGGLADLPASLRNPGPPVASQMTLEPASRALTAHWEAPVDDGGSPITGYTVTLQPGNVVHSLDASASRSTSTGLVNGTDYTVTLAANNARGHSDITAHFVVKGTSKLLITRTPLIVEGQAASVVVTVVDQQQGNQPVPGQRVRLLSHLPSTPTHNGPEASAITDSHGQAHFTVRPTRTLEYQAAFDGSATQFSASADAFATVTVRSRITGTLSPARIKLGQTSVLSGSEPYAGVRVYLQQLTGTTWKTIASTTTTARNTYAIRIKPIKRATYSYRMLIPNQKYNASNYTSTLKLQVI